MNDTTTFGTGKSYSAKLKDLPAFTTKQVVWLVILGLLAGMALATVVHGYIQLKGLDDELNRYREHPVSMQGVVYYDSESKGVAVVYWKHGKPICDMARVQSAVCRNLWEADSITIKTPWP